VPGRITDADADEPYRHPEVFAREQTSGPERLRIGGGAHPIGLLVSLARVLRQPLFLLVELRLVLATDVPKRYESEALSLPEVAAFFEDFDGFFTHDGRASAWIGSTDGDGLLVLDEHDLIYAYGLLGVFEDVLLARGFAPGFAEIPEPHGHHYPAQWSAEELRLAGTVTWRRVLEIDEDELDDEDEEDATG
jgi:hypothetical protein